MCAMVHKRCGVVKLFALGAIGFSGKSAFLESVSFQMLDATNFGLILGNCIVIAMFFI